MVLPAAAGWLDATAYFRVHTFAANMTGNTVLLALNAASGHGGEAALGGVAIVAFIAGAFGGAAYSARRVAPLLVARDLLFVVSALLAGVAAIAILTPTSSFAWRFAFLAVAALGMGLQQTATRVLHPKPTISTTYMSGTVERIGSGLYEAVATRTWDRFSLNAAIWLVFLLAAFGAGFVAGFSNGPLAIVPCVITAIATAVLWRCDGATPASEV
jgi:uncharacterized membrane protein YoaK (UPF0700 family)